MVFTNNNVLKQLFAPSSDVCDAMMSLAPKSRMCLMPTSPRKTKTKGHDVTLVAKRLR